MAVVHEYMAPVAGQYWMGDGLAREPRHCFGEDCDYGIGAGSAGVVAELDAAKITFGMLLTLLGCSESLTGPSRWRLWAVLAIDSLQRRLVSPGLEQSAFHRAVLNAEKGFHLRYPHQLLQWNSRF